MRKDDITDLREQVDRTKEALVALREAIERYGIPAGALPPRFRKLAFRLVKKESD
jgi:hypothetical protein